MKHYTEFIPKDLALKLQDAGMPIDWENNSPDEHPNTEVNCLNTYAEVMDWFMEKQIDIIPRPYVIIKDGEYERTSKFAVHLLSPVITKFSVIASLSPFEQSWESAMEYAIKRAIKLLEETQKH